jgi:hypothetical protein
MDLRTTGSRDERRRRVLIDDAQAEPAHGDEPRNPPARRSKSESSASKGTRYSLESLDRGQPRIADLLPKRRLTLWLWLLAATMVIAALVALDVASAGWRAKRPEIDWSIFRLDALGSMANWVAALVLAWAGFAGLQIYLIRRHRSDDYRGGYRLWSSAAVLLTIASLDAATSLHSFLGRLAGSLLGAAQYSEWIGIGLVAVIGIAFGARMVWEIKPSRGALATFAVAALCYLAAIAPGAGLMDALPVRTTLVAATAALCGHALVLLTVGVFGRYVFLEAHGQLPLRVRKPKNTPSPETPSRKRSSKPKGNDASPDVGGDGKKRGKTDVEGAAPAEKRPPEPAKKPPEQKPAPAASASPQIAGKVRPVNDEDDDEDAEGSPRLSKAERRKLRKQQFHRKAA